MSHKLWMLGRAVSITVATAFICFGQVERGGISGIVTDPTSASMGRVKISATNEATKVVTRTESTEEGLYKIPYLPAGKYSLVMESPGFATYGGRLPSKTKVEVIAQLASKGVQ